MFVKKEGKFSLLSLPRNLEAALPGSRGMECDFVDALHNGLPAVFR